RRDRVSFAMIIMLPVMQLLLFGYAINTTPHNLPTAVLLQEDSDLGRSILKAMENTAYFRFTREVSTVEEFDDLLESGKVLFGVEIPRGLARSGPWCRPRSRTTSMPARRPRCLSRSGRMLAIIRRRRRGSTSCPGWS